MSQQIDTDSVALESSVLEVQNSTSTFETNSSATVSQPISEAIVMKERSFTERWETHRFLLIRGSYLVLNSIWMAVMAIGAFIAWIIAMLFI